MRNSPSLFPSPIAACLERWSIRVEFGKWQKRLLACFPVLLVALMLWHFSMILLHVLGNVLISDGGDNIMRLVLFYLLFANTTAYFSADADAYWRRRPLVEHTMWYKIKAVLHNFAVLFCIINLCIMYLTSGLYQVMGEVWHNGTAVYYILQVDEYSHPFFQNLILQNDFLIVLSTYASVIDENVVQLDEAAVEPRREDGLGQMGSVFALGGCPQFPAVYLVRAGVPNGRARPEAAAGVAVAGRLASARAFERHRIRHQFSGSGGDAALRLYALFGGLSALRTVYQGSAAGTGAHPPGKQRTGLKSRQPPETAIPQPSLPGGLFCLSRMVAVPCTRRKEIRAIPPGS